jgi:hypothetical protein
MRFQVQVLAGPPPISAGHSAAGSEPGAPAAGLGRVGAARPSPPARPSALPGPVHPGGRLHDDHAPWSPTQPKSGSHPAGTATPRRQPAALRTPAWPAWSRSGYARPPHPTRPGRQRLPTDQRATPAASPAPGLLGRRPSRSTAWQPTRTSTGSRGDGCPAAPAWSPTPPPEVGGDGRVRTDGADTGQAGHRTGWTPDGLDCRIPDDDPGWVDTRCWTPTDAMAGVLVVSTRAMAPDRWMAAGRSAGQPPSGRARTQDRSAARTPSAPRCYRPAWQPPRPSAAGGRRPSSRAPRRTALLGRISGRA